MDNPDPWAIRLNQSMKNLGYSHAFDVPGLRKSGHREPKTTTGWAQWWRATYVWRKRGGCTQLLLLLQTISCRTFRDECKQSLAKAVPGMRNRLDSNIKEAMPVGVKEGKDRQEFFNVKLTDILTHQLVPARRIKRWHTDRPVQPRQTLPRQSTSTAGRKKRMARLIGPCQGRIRSQGKQEGLADHLSLFILLELTHSLKKLSAFIYTLPGRHPIILGSTAWDSSANFPVLQLESIHK
jgi:hypothetical protein